MSVISSDDMVMLEGRKRGRPKVSEPRSTVSTWIPASQHDKLIKLAKQREVSVSCLVRALIRDAPISLLNK